MASGWNITLSDQKVQGCKHWALRSSMDMWQFRTCDGLFLQNPDVLEFCLMTQKRVRPHVRFTGHWNNLFWLCLVFKWSWLETIFAAWLAEKRTSVSIIKEKGYFRLDRVIGDGHREKFFNVLFLCSLLWRSRTAICSITAYSYSTRNTDTSRSVFPQVHWIEKRL